LVVNKTSFVTGVALAAMLAQASADEASPSSQPTLTTTAPTPAPGRDFHLGVNFRTDFGTRYYRADLGLRFGRWDAIVVVDPLGIQKGDYDFDALVRYRFASTWSAWAGGRLSIVPIGRANQLTEKALVGVSAELPSGTDRVRIHSGLELAVHVAAHGGDIMTRWLCVDSPACREDHFVFSLFGRVEYASRF
jgi:hypothetical protein